MAKKETIDLSDVTAPVVTVATENLGTIDSIRDLHQSDTKINLKDKKSAETSYWSNRKNPHLVKNKSISTTHFVSQNAVGDGATIKNESKSKTHKKDNIAGLVGDLVDLGFISLIIFITVDTSPRSPVIVPMEIIPFRIIG